jgi:hypothetical protein
LSANAARREPMRVLIARAFGEPAGQDAKVRGPIASPAAAFIERGDRSGHCGIAERARLRRRSATIDIVVEGFVCFQSGGRSRVDALLEWTKALAKR